MSLAMPLALPRTGHSEIEMIEFAFAACRRAAAYAEIEDRIGLATAAALLRCEVTERFTARAPSPGDRPTHDLNAALDQDGMRERAEPGPDDFPTRP